MYAYLQNAGKRFRAQIGFARLQFRKSQFRIFRKVGHAGKQNAINDIMLSFFAPEKQQNKRFYKEHSQQMPTFWQPGKQTFKNCTNNQSRTQTTTKNQTHKTHKNKYSGTLGGKGNHTKHNTHICWNIFGFLDSFLLSVFLYVLCCFVVPLWPGKPNHT